MALLLASHRQLRAFWLIKVLPRVRCSHATSGCKDFQIAGCIAESALHQAEAADHAISRCHALAQACAP